MSNPTKIVICAGGEESQGLEPCGNCGVPVEIELTDEEVAEMKALADQANAEFEAQQAEAERINAVKLSARTKLVTGQPLTEEEASLLVI